MLTPFLRYTILRLLLFIAVTALLALAGMRGLLLLAVAVLGSGLVSLVVLRRPRDEVSRAIVARQQQPRSPHGPEPQDGGQPGTSAPDGAAGPDEPDGGAARPPSTPAG